MRALLPEAACRVNLAEVYSRGLPRPLGQPFVRLNMISSLDGAIAVSGRSGGLGGAADRAVFTALRSLADVVLVGAGTARTEHYGPAELAPEVQAARQERGQSRLPSVAVVTRSGDIDWSSRLFGTAGAGPRPVVIAPGTAEAGALAKARSLADLVTAGHSCVDLSSALRQLGERGMNHVLCEGGPQLAASLQAAQLIDELCLTLSPHLAGSSDGLPDGGWLGGPGRRAAVPAGPGTLRRLALVHVLEDDGYLFLRLRTPQSTGPPAT